MDVYVVYEGETHIKPPIGVYGSLEKAQAQAHEAASDLVRSLGARVIQDGCIGDDQNSIIYGNSQGKAAQDVLHSQIGSGCADQTSH